VSSVDAEMNEAEDCAKGNPSSPPVGYKNPPALTQFKKGQSGNKRGRPIGSRNFCTILEPVLQEGVRVSDGLWISKTQALVKRAFYGAMKGEPGAVKALDLLADKLGLLNPCGRQFGYLVVPEKLPRDEWQKVALRALEQNMEPDPRFKRPEAALPKITRKANRGEDADVQPK
jgi:hypothetical protein